MNCDECGEFECEIDHDDSEQDDDSGMFDGSGMTSDKPQ
jgi:hypothetical protein